jgi:hypothetical protein
VNRKTLTLSPSPARLKRPPPPVPADPLKIALSVAIGLRYVSRGGRYTQQVYVSVGDHAPNERTWVDVPLCPEVYG